MTMGSKLESLRRRAERLMRSQKPVVLMYHQIADLSVDPWALAVSPAKFAEQIEALSAEREIVPLKDVLSPRRTRGANKPLAAITFDDGYKSVVTLGRPVL